ncbi:MAG: 3'(2'),5'-bisphosphate nucleotidase CysQ [Plectolyngbya sp. WJT66-NPBG17]|jgi:3'(2'), 5'-bisphosphate nucleotidase|nr:3'(2'),5'-bisphosphate nucleotidase CysQ [Plectolyngbya sp. WJT66-NPBG17]
MNFEGICAIARRVGWGAANILLEQSRSFEVEKSGDSPVTSADIAANTYILEKLQVVFDPETFAYLSEETYQSQPTEVRLNRPWVWIIDPLDGTKDFINRTGEYAMHIALAYQGRPVVAIVACPAFGKLYSATLRGGTWVETENGDRQRLQASNKAEFADLTVVASRNHRGGRFNQLMEQFPVKQQHQIGSVGCKIAAIVEQQADLYLSLSGKSAPKDWDFAAPELILTEAGGQFTYFDQSPLQYNREDVNQWGGILASNGQMHDRLCQTATDLLTAIDKE